MIHEMCCKKYNLINFGDAITKSRIKNKNFSEYEQLISFINENDNICVKLNGNDFFDAATNTIVDLYKKIDYNSFDKIIFLIRTNIVDAVLSYAYMDPADDKTWHRRKNQAIELKEYYISPQKVHHLLNGYIAYDTIKRYIQDSSNAEVYDYEYETVHYLIEELDLEVDINLVPMAIDYKSIVTNYDEVLAIIRDFG